MKQMFCFETVEDSWVQLYLALRKQNPPACVDALCACMQVRWDWALQLPPELLNQPVPISEQNQWIKDWLWHNNARGVDPYLKFPPPGQSLEAPPPSDRRSVHWLWYWVHNLNWNGICQRDLLYVNLKGLTKEEPWCAAWKGLIDLQPDWAVSTVHERFVSWRVRLEQQFPRERVRCT